MKIEKDIELGLLETETTVLVCETVKSMRYNNKMCCITFKGHGSFVNINMTQEEYKQYVTEYKDCLKKHKQSKEKSKVKRYIERKGSRK